MKCIQRIIFIVTLCLPIAGCGRYGPPLAPEVLAPRTIPAFVALGQETGVHFAWTAPHNDSRGKELKSMTEYRLYRKIITQPSDVTDRSVEFTLIAAIEDTHIELRDQRRAAARAEGKPGRRIEAPAASTKFEYLDGTVTQGMTYYYKLVPVNQGDVEGEYPMIVSVLFDGLKSQITPITDTSEVDTASGGILGSL